MQLGFIGLGAMGGGMASNLLNKGYKLVGYDSYRPLVEKYEPQGLIPAKSCQEAAEKADFLILMVINAQQVDSILFNEKVAEIMKPNSTILISSTVPPDYIRDMETRLTSVRSDIKLIDCPVSGGALRAAKGTLSIFSSGSDDALKGASEVLNAMSDPLYTIPGGIGMGSIAKMCHQHHASVNIVTASEAMSVAAAAGLDTKLVYDSVCQSLGYTWMFSNRVPRMFENNYKNLVLSANSIITKDAKIVTSYAQLVDVPVILQGMSLQLYLKALNEGLAKEDDAGLVKLYLSEEKVESIKVLANSGSKTGKSDITIQSIIDLLVGINVASAYECFAYAAKVGLDSELLVNIISEGAGNTSVFKSTKQDFDKFPKLNQFPGGKDIRQKLVSKIMVR